MRGGGAAHFRASAARRAYLDPFAQDLPRPRLYAPKQRVLDHAQHAAAVALGTHRRSRAEARGGRAGGRLGSARDQRWRRAGEGGTREAARGSGAVAALRLPRAARQGA